MVVFAFRIDDLAEGTALSDPLHFQIEEHLRIVFGEEIHGVGVLFRRTDQRNAFCHGAVADAFGIHVDSPLKASDGVGSVFVEEVRKDHRIYAVFNEGVEIVVNSGIGELSLRFFKAHIAEIAYRSNLASQSGKIDCQVNAASCTEHTDSVLFHNDLLKKLI